MSELPYPYAATPPPGAPDREHGPLEYHQIHRTGRQGWWWGLVGAVAMLAFFAIIGPILIAVPLGIYLVARYGGEGGADKLTELADTTNATPAVLVFVFVVLIVSLPGSWLVQRVVNGLRPRTLGSVAARIRWRWLLVSFGVAFVALLAAILLGALLPAGADDVSFSGGANEFTSTARDFLLVVILFVPLQATAEEYVFRGYLTQAMGSFSADLWISRALAVLVPALIFALFHGLGQSAPIFFDRFAFGVVAGVLAIATGGLEAGIAYHILNNLLAFILAIFYSDMSQALNPTGGSWADVIVSLVKSLIFVGLSILVARRMGVQTRTEPSSGPTVLAAPPGRV